MSPEPARPPNFTPLAPPAAPHFTRLADPPPDPLAVVQQLVAAWLAAPAWWAWALLGAAAILTVLGRHGQRPVSAALLGGGGFAAVRAFVPDSALLAPIVAGIGAAVGLGAPAFGVAALFAAAGVWVAAGLHQKLEVPLSGALIPLAVLGFVLGLANHRRASIALPSLVAAGCATLAGLRLLGGAGQALEVLQRPVWLGGATLALAAGLTLVNAERDRSARASAVARAERARREEQLQRAEAQRARFAAALEGRKPGS